MSTKLPVNISTEENTTASPYPIQILREDPWHDFTKHNGYIPLAKRLMLKVISDIDECEDVWNDISPNRKLFDLWEIRKSFFESYKSDPYFLTIFEQKGLKENLLGVLPLWVDDDDYKGQYAWYGGYWPEENNFFVRDLEVIPLLLMAAPSPLCLQCIDPIPDYDFLESLHGFSFEKDKKYFMNLSKYHTVNEYLTSLKKKKRYNIKRDRKIILANHPNVILNNFSHLERLFELNIARFRGKYVDTPSEYSIFEDIRQKNLFRKFIANSHVAEPRMISTVINGNVEAVEMGFIFNRTYYALSSGANIMKYSGLGVYSNLLVIEDALKNGCEKIDFFEGDYNWKDSWNLDTFFHYKFVK
jgi:hypothetical protein